MSGHLSIDRRPKRPIDRRDAPGGPPGKRGPGLAPSEFTNDPSTVASRIFVGGLPEDITRDELKDHFTQWGNIQSVSITKNKFGFVQYDTVEEAEYCLSQGSTTTIKGQKVDVKPAKIKTDTGNAVFRSAQSAREGYSPPRRGPGPPRGSGDYFPPDLYPREERIDPFGGSRYGEDYFHDPYQRERLPPPLPSRDNGFFRDEERPPPPPRSYVPPAVYPPVEPAAADPLDPSRPNDVEIVVPSKMQRPFAESIELELKRMQMKVDLLFPPPEVSPTQVVQDLTRRRCLFALFATSENEGHHSVTVNILHGVPQEHRNMPVEDAFRLIQQNFDEYVKKGRQRNMREVVPRDVRNLVLDLLEMRPLSMGDLDKMIKYLRERQNALVDDQIEQKRENAGSKAAAGVSSLAVSYPSYNYVASQSATLAGSSGLPTQAVSLLPATNATAYPQVAYGTAAQGVLAYGQAGASAPQIAPLMGGRVDSQQDRYMQMAKGGQVQGQPPVGVPAPIGVPAPQSTGSLRSGPPPHIPSGRGTSSWNPGQQSINMESSVGPAWGSSVKIEAQGSKQTKSYNPWGALM